MNKSRIINFFTIILLMLSSFQVFGQKNDVKIHNILDLISFFEKQESVKFSFSNNALKDLEINLKKDNTNFQEFLKAIENQTIFTVKKGKDENYIIYQNTKVVSICGKVIDSYTSKAISEILVSGTESNAYTDEKGEFTVKTKASNDVVFSGIGYNTIALKAKSLIKDECATVRVFEKSEELDEIVLISDYITLGIDKKNDGSIELTPSKLKVIPGLVEPDVLQSIQLLPGVNSPRGGASDISIRGGNSDQNLILWDGIKMYNSGHFFDQISAFNPYITESTKIFTSGTTARYSLHTGGVIDISSVTKVPKKIVGSAGVNLTNYDANLNIPIAKKIGLIVAGRHSENKLFDVKFNNIKKKVFNDTSLDEDNENDDITEFNNKFKFYDVNAKLVWDLSDKSKLQLSSIFMNNLLLFDSELAETFKNKDTVEIQNKGVSLQWKKSSSKNVLHNFSSYYSNYDYSLRRNETFGDNSLNSEQKNVVRDIGGIYNIMFPINKKIRLLSGYEYIYNDVIYLEKNDQQDFFGIQNINIVNSLNTHSIFSELTYDHDFIKIRAGLRANHFSELENITYEPRFLTSFSLTDALQMSISAEWKNQVLRQSYQISNNRLPSIKNAWILTSGERKDNSAIPNLESQQYSVGASYNIKDFGIIFESYLKKNQGLVVLDNETETINDDSYFTGKGTVVGLDILIKKKIGKYRTWFGYSISQNLLFFSNLNKKKDFLNNIDTTHIINWSHTFDVGNFELGVSWNYRSGLSYSEPSGVFISSNGEPVLEYEELNNLKLPYFQNINASVLYALQLSKKNDVKIKLGISIQNLLNRQNILGREYKLNPVSNQEPDIILDNVNIYAQDNISLPLTPDFLFRIQF